MSDVFALIHVRPGRYVVVMSWYEDRQINE